MPKVDRTSKGIRVLTTHGVNIQDKGDQWQGDCPFCQRENKFYVSSDEGLWSCKVCGASGNPLSFLRRLHIESEGHAGFEDYRELAEDRRLLHTDTLIKWGVVKSILTDEWLIPFYDCEGKLRQLCRYAQIGSPVNKWVLMPTPTASQITDGLAGIELFNPDSDTVYLCEKPWDAMCLWETLHIRGDSKASVLSLRTCSVFDETMTAIFEGKRVVIIMDNDYERVNQKTEKNEEGAGYLNTKRITHILSASDKPPKEVHYLNWGGDSGVTHNPNLPDGWDVRDHLPAGTIPSIEEGTDEMYVWVRDEKKRLENLDDLLSRVSPSSQEWITAGMQEGLAKKGQSRLEPLYCDDWKTLQEAWRRALKWIDGLDRTLSVMLTGPVSVDMLDAPLWIRVVGPPASGKSTLAEAMLVSRKHTKMASLIRGFYTGYQTDKEGTEDHSLILKLKDKVAITKDGDTLLQSQYRDQVLSQARDIYDGSASTQYGNKMSRDYSNIRFIWILMGTDSLRSLDSAEMGERFIDCRIMDRIEEDLEEHIGRSAIRRTISTKGMSANGRAESFNEQNLTEAMRLTGGYIEYLRKNGSRLRDEIKVSEEVEYLLFDYARMVAYMRARPSKKQDESASREICTRLCVQLTKLSICLAVVLNKEEVDKEVMRRVRYCAIDTCHGKTLEVLKHLSKQKDGLTPVALEDRLRAEFGERVTNYLKFLHRIGVIEKHFPSYGKNVSGSLHYRMTPTIKDLYRKVIQGKTDKPESKDGGKQDNKGDSNKEE